MRIWVKRILASLLAVGVLGLAGFLIFAPAIVEKGQNGVVAHEPYPVSQAARALHERLVIGDWHADSLLWNRDLLKRSNYGQVDFPRLKAGNVAVQVLTTVTKSPSGQNYDQNSAEAGDRITLLAMGQLWPFRTWNSLTERALYQSQKLHEFAERAEGTIRIIRTRRDLAAVLAARAVGQDLTGIVIGAEGGHALDRDQANLGRLFDAGFRLMGLQHFFDNALGGSLHGRSGAGLTEFGISVVHEMAERGMVIDLAHSSQAVAREVLEITDVPVIVSHTGIFSHCQTKRNFPDDLMAAIAARGGLIGIGYWADVTCDASPDGVAGAIRAAIALVGADHVALGSDFDGAVETAFDASELAALTDALLRAGVSEGDIVRVMGANMMAFLQSQLPE